LVVDKQACGVNTTHTHPPPTHTDKGIHVATEVEIIGDNDWTVNCDQYVGVGLAVLKPEYPGEMQALIEGLTIAFHVRQREVKDTTRH
jgi:hypothetical protein